MLLELLSGFAPWPQSGLSNKSILFCPLPGTATPEIATWFTDPACIYTVYIQILKQPISNLTNSFYILNISINIMYKINVVNYHQ